MVPHNTVILPTAQLENNVATKQHKDKQLYKRENMKENDVEEGGRSTLAGLGVNTYYRHLDQNLKNDRTPAPQKKTRR